MFPILIGTSGYDHPELKGSFYPPKLARKDFLEYYSTKFNALEINSTFYGIPTAERLYNFYERSQGRVKFSIKMNRLLTHEIDRQWQNHAENFKTALLSLQEKDVLSSVLIQFPESFGYSIENRRYLSNLLHNMEPFSCVVEFRNKSWIRDSVFEGLDSRKTGIVFCDMPPCASPFKNLNLQLPFIGNNAYVRMHGRNENGWYANNNPNQETQRYDYEYSLEELISFVPIIRAVQKGGSQVQIYFNNHPKGVGFQNALQLMELLQISKPKQNQGELDFITDKMGTDP